MALPKRKHSKARTRSGRAKWRRAQTPLFTKCESCGKPRLPHHACTNYKCGRYRVQGELREVIRFRERKSLEREKTE